MVALAPSALWEFKFPWQKSAAGLLYDIQVGGTAAAITLPTALSFKAANTFPTLVAARTLSPAAAATTGATTGGTAGATAAGLTAASVLPLVGTGMKIGGGLMLLQWLEKNWWIVAILLGGLIAYKYVK